MIKFRQIWSHWYVGKKGLEREVWTSLFLYRQTWRYYLELNTKKERDRELFRIYEAFYMEFSLLACLPIILCSTLGMIGAFCFNY